MSDSPAIPVLQKPKLPSITLAHDAPGTFEQSHKREWLLTNGIGGFACSTVGGCNTRRYHGLLIASLQPPVDRVLMVSKLDAIAHYAENEYQLATNEFADGTIDPQGYQLINEFRVEGQTAIWVWLVGDALLEQRIWMAHGQNTTYISYRQLRGSGVIELNIRPLCSYRDYHAQFRGQRDAALRALDSGFEVIVYPEAHPYRILIENGEYTLNQQWCWNFKHREESARGLDDIEDLFSAGNIKLRLQVGIASTVIVTTETIAPMPATESMQRELARQQELLTSATVDNAALAIRSPTWIQQLVLAADQFIVDRRDAGNNTRGETTLGKTVIAGYPWFSDWGRDTMIALSGLTIATGRYDVAASILRMFAKFISEGMLPNRFPDGGEPPEYNTVDAALWYFIAIHDYLHRTNDDAFRVDLYPVLKDIIQWHVRGTRYGIHVDSADGLLFAGDATVQLTWMDAKVGDKVVTPRTGKCVEINALWFNALSITVELANQQRDLECAREFASIAARVATNFERRFWYEQGSYLFDVIDDPAIAPDSNGERRDASVRPNQLLAVSLPYALLSDEHAQSVVDVCAGELLTPVGLRSLSAHDSRYSGVYQGGPSERDGAYHQGTVWSWLLGPFISAHLRVYGDVEAARSYLNGMAAHLREACIGQVSEIFDGNIPFTPRGCFAQAWGVAEILRLWSELNEHQRRSNGRVER